MSSETAPAARPKKRKRELRRDPNAALASALEALDLDEEASMNYRRAHTSAARSVLHLRYLNDYLSRGRLYREADEDFLNWLRLTFFREFADGSFKRFADLCDVSSEFRLRGTKGKEIPAEEEEAFLRKALNLGDEFAPGFARSEDAFILFASSRNLPPTSCSPQAETSLHFFLGGPLNET
jgi:hypothetical protein